MYKERYPNVLETFSENMKLLSGKAVGIDIDAVTQATYILALNKASYGIGKIIQREDLKTYWELAEIAKKNGIAPEKAIEFALSAWNDDYVYANAPVMPGITDLLQMFNEVSVPYLHISSRPVEFLDTTKKFFENAFFPFINSENIILGRKEGVSGGDFKAEMINKYNVGLFIEDSTEEAEIIVKNTDAKVIIVPQPWNEKVRFEHPRIKYLGSYKESNGSWSVLRFLASKEANKFLDSVAQSY
jgi:uncharacterized HAD superfamily protein